MTKKRTIPGTRSGAPSNPKATPAGHSPAPALAFARVTDEEATRTYYTLNALEDDVIEEHELSRQEFFELKAALSARRKSDPLLDWKRPSYMAESVPAA